MGRNDTYFSTQALGCDDDALQRAIHHVAWIFWHHGSSTHISAL